MVRDITEGDFCDACNSRVGGLVPKVIIPMAMSSEVMYVILCRDCMLKAREKSFLEFIDFMRQKQEDVDNG